MTAQKSISMQATIGGLAARAGGAWSVFGELDLATGVLLVDVVKPHPPGTPEKRLHDAAFVTNNTNTDDHDLLFTEADLQDAISDFYAFAGRGLLVLDDAVKSHDPESRIESDGLDEHGRKYRISPDMTNAQIAVIVLCWFATRQAGFSRQIDAFDELMDTDIESVGIGRSGDREVIGYAMGGELRIGRDGWPIE